MLAKANRITSADDYRFIVRRGAKVAGALTVSYIRSREPGTDARFGFIVSKKVGSAVRRNLVRRRLKAAGREFVDGGTSAVDVVVRALPSASAADFAALRGDLASALVRGVGSASRGRRAAASADHGRSAVSVPEDS
ncbi:ribonuclease P protein component [Agromyces marinus]|uniref:Ribonuclease P protein component n=1 Tax=Agromyces marinus TaxID=1389020 RepID=A0ABN6YH69_9MICO|nr:ribonuclease P protein component [Agromyces marinus]UIP60106.1 Ribonuclease P protein component [Agromyces marinus]BDZ54773.1 ribonuclease P protein component [Agromyces marinus]